MDCFNKYLDDEQLTEKDVIMDIDLCEDCGEWKPCVIRIKKKNPLDYLKHAIRNLFKIMK